MPQSGKDADEQEKVAEHLQHELGEEAGNGCHITVHPLDKLTRRAPGVKRRVETQAVQGEIGAQGVGRAPADPLAQIHSGDGERLLNH